MGGDGISAKHMADWALYLHTPALLGNGSTEADRVQPCDWLLLFCTFA